MFTGPLVLCFFGIFFFFFFVCNQVLKLKIVFQNDELKDLIKKMLDSANLEEVTMKTVLKDVSFYFVFKSNINLFFFCIMGFD